jgi:hypothetical protein
VDSFCQMFSNVSEYDIMGESEMNLFGIIDHFDHDMKR